MISIAASLILVYCFRIPLLGSRNGVHDGRAEVVVVGCAQI